jgi:hypothetical protein
MSPASALSAPASCRRNPWGRALGRSGRRSASMPSSAITTGGRWTRSARRASPTSRIPVMENDAVLMSATTGRRSGWPGSAISSPTARLPASSGVSTTCRGRSPASPRTATRSCFWRTSRISSRRAGTRVSLTLSGHTHGGQVAVPFLGRPIVPSAYGERFAYGHIVEERPPPDRFRRPRLLDAAGPVRRAAGNRADRTRRRGCRGLRPAIVWGPGLLSKPP